VKCIQKVSSIRQVHHGRMHLRAEFDYHNSGGIIDIDSRTKVTCAGRRNETA